MTPPMAWVGGAFLQAAVSSNPLGWYCCSNELSTFLLTLT